MIDTVGSFLNEIKYAYQRVVRGYDERIGWSFDSYFDQFIPPLKKFCQKQLSKEYIKEYNKDKVRIFKKTLDLIAKYETRNDLDWYKHPNIYSRLWKYVGEHISYYWD
ncbi:MAG: hypothetical protein WC648_04205 [Candidatus Paceibacterota bacterium]|jgi:hypothetical protein